jgi:hypothetical protein
VALATLITAALGIWHPWSEYPVTPPDMTSDYVQTHLVNAPPDMLGGDISQGLLLATSVETSQ